MRLVCAESFGGVSWEETTYLGICLRTGGATHPAQTFMPFSCTNKLKKSLHLHANSCQKITRVHAMRVPCGMQRGGGDVPEYGMASATPSPYQHICCAWRERREPGSANQARALMASPARGESGISARRSRLFFFQEFVVQNDSNLSQINCS